MTDPLAPAISVVVPTHDRRDLVLRCLASLARQDALPGTFEVIVVSDGCRDGTSEALEGLDLPYPLRVLRQEENRGLSAARNLGNRHARGEWIVCLDCDMIADPRLVSEHHAAHRGKPAGLVQGALAIDPGVRRTPFLRHEERVLESFHREKAAGDGRLEGEEVSGGNVSLSRALLEQVGGFNERLRRNTDGELAFRLEAQGIPLRYAPRALASMTHMKDLDESLAAAFGYGRAYVETCREQPESTWHFSPLVRDRSSGLRNTARRWLYLRAGRRWSLGWLERATRLTIGAVEALGLERPAATLYRFALDLHFWKGVHAASGGDLEAFRPRRVAILCYHDVSDRSVPAFRRYVLPMARFRHQMEWLARNGYRVVSVSELLLHLERGAPLPPRAVVLTFDDGYRELATTAIPCLAAAGYPHTHFVNTAKLGGTTDWVEAAPDLPILTAQEVRDLADRHGAQVDFQAHGRTHLSLAGQDGAVVAGEVRESVEALARITGRSVDLLAYPYGEYDASAVEVVRRLGLRAAFTVDQGLCHPGQDPHRLPRVEIFTEDLGFEFGFKVRWGFGPLGLVRRRLPRRLRRFLRAAIGRR